MKILVAGIGNVFLGDDGFGVEVARRLCRTAVPDGVRVADYGIRGMHLAHDLANSGYDLTIMIDSVDTGDPAGTVCVIELDPAGAPSAELLDAHGMQPDVVLGLVRLLGATPGRVLLVGCCPASLDHRIGLSPAVSVAVDTAADEVVALVREELSCAWASPAK
ncbi:hydrogenase maturation protease [Actinocrispum wychmicini]|uniref:Hydrogenase maturation protease n=1 Tax=Actinocrispum wychmicini TaxID=1213861 RepID=A0A4R2JQA9_9PSEU|nr:hydrogenase maturation protease [Actinocrispum wychmicini]TCO62403.1 hydrogenase maturation protease [Actinocrispum wychmicini]